MHEIFPLMLVRRHRMLLSDAERSRLMRSDDEANVVSDGAFRAFELWGLRELITTAAILKPRFGCFTVISIRC